MGDFVEKGSKALGGAVQFWCAFIGGIIGAVIIIVALVIFAVYLVQKRKNNRTVPVDLEGQVRSENSSAVDATSTKDKLSNDKVVGQFDVSTPASKYDGSFDGGYVVADETASKIDDSKNVSESTAEGAQTNTMNDAYLEMERSLQSDLYNNSNKSHGDDTVSGDKVIMGVGGVTINPITTNKTVSSNISSVKKTTKADSAKTTTAKATTATKSTSASKSGTAAKATTSKSSAGTTDTKRTTAAKSDKGTTATTKSSAVKNSVTGAKTAVDRIVTPTKTAEKATTAKAKSAIPRTVTPSAKGGKWQIVKQADDEFVCRLYASNGEMMLESEVYSSASSARSGIDTLKKNIIMENFDMHRDKNGSYSYKVKSMQNRILCVGDTYKSKTACTNAVESVKRFALTAPTVSDVMEEKTVIIYHPTKVVKPETDAPKGKWTIKKIDENSFVAALVASNGEPMLFSEDYSTNSAAKTAIETIKTNALASNFVICKSKAGKYYFKLRNESRNTMCVGEFYESQSRVEQAIESVKRFVQTAELES